MSWDIGLPRRSVVLAALLLIVALGLVGAALWPTGDELAPADPEELRRVLGLEESLPPELYSSVAAIIQADSGPSYHARAVSDLAPGGRPSPPSAYRASNLSNDFETTFDSSGIGVVLESASADTALAMRLTGYGYGGWVQAMGDPTLSAEGNRVSYLYQIGEVELEEWYVNGSLGLEQGFTLNAPPPLPRSEAGRGFVLRLELDLGGALRPVLDAGGLGISFRDRQGVTVLRYGGLMARDAGGRELPVGLSLDGNRLSLLVDDADAEYPVTVDPFIQKAKLTTSDGAAGDQFGWSVGISGDTVVVGARFADVGGETEQGSAYVFTRPGGGWITTSTAARLTASDGAAGDRFGYSVAISGDTVVVGAETAGNLNQGSAYVFTRPGGGWITTSTAARLTASDGEAFDKFGISVAISGDTVVVGACSADVGGNAGQGSAYVFTKPGEGWSSTSTAARLTASDGADFDGFGVSVAISGDTVVVGAHSDDVGGNQFQGSAYVFTRPGGGWSATSTAAKLTASDGGVFDQFGVSVAISGDTVVVGAQGAIVGGNQEQGSAYVYTRPGGGWSATSIAAKLTASDGAAGDSFGISVAISGDTVVVGAFFDDVGGNLWQGSAYVFTKPGGGWSATSAAARLTASDGEAGDSFGISVAISGDTLIVGAFQADVGGNSSQGAAYRTDATIGVMALPATGGPSNLSWIVLAASLVGAFLLVSGIYTYRGTTRRSA